MSALPVPLVILTGFLGAGKTTVLNRVLGAQHRRRLVVIVNELGRIDIDSRILRARSGTVVELAGGCVCHEVRTLEELWQALAEVLLDPEPSKGSRPPAMELHTTPSRRTGSGTLGRRSRLRSDATLTRPDCIVLETTGIAEPEPLLAGLADHPEHGRSVVTARVVTVVDAEAGLDVLERHPEARAQVVTADRLLLSKTDLADSERIRTLHEALARLNPDAERASFPADGQGTAALVPWLLDRLEPRLPSAHAEPHAAHAHGQLDVLAFSEESPLVAEPLLAVCGRLGSALVRAKGFVHLAGEPRRAFLERAGARLSLDLGEPWPPGPRRSEIVLIGEGLDAASLQRQLWACRAPRGALV